LKIRDYLDEFMEDLEHEFNRYCLFRIKFLEAKKILKDIEISIYETVKEFEKDLDEWYELYETDYEDE